MDRNLFNHPEDYLGAATQKVTDFVNILGETVKGVYYDSQVEKLAMDPKDPAVVKDLEKRLKSLQDLSVEDYMAVTAPEGTGGIGSLGINAVKKKNQEKALQNLLDHYSRKFDTTKK